jgi:hypothetical protein
MPGLLHHEYFVAFHRVIARSTLLDALRTGYDFMDQPHGNDMMRREGERCDIRDKTGTLQCEAMEMQRE